MKVVAVLGDLLLFSRIEAAASSAGASLDRVDSLDQLLDSHEVDLVLIDWSARTEGWAAALADLQANGRARIVLFGQHTDLAAHAAARAARAGPMWARSRLVRDLPSLLSRPA